AEDEEAAGMEPVLKPEMSSEAFEERIVLYDLDACVRPGEDADLDDLCSDERQRDEAEHRVDLPRPTEDVHGAAREGEHSGEPEEQEKAARHEIEPARAVQEHETHVSPRVAGWAELGRAGAREVVDRDLAHRQASAIGLEDHLRRELHSGRVEVEPLERIAAGGSHSAMRVRDLHAEEPVQHPGVSRVSDVSIRPGHRAAMDLAVEPGSDDEVGAPFQAP